MIEERADARRKTAARIIGELQGELGAALRGVCDDSRQVAAGQLYVAYRGDEYDGRDYIADAIARGAAAVLWESRRFAWWREWRVANCGVANARAVVGYVADEIYARPSREMSVAAVTGTNGKTTATYFIAQLMRCGGRRSAVVGTTGIGDVDGDKVDVGYTTPPPARLQRALRKLADAGFAAVAVEASSHGLRQGRLNGVLIRVAVFTRLGRDHLDYHRSARLYAAAKARLFKHPGLEAAVLNADDAFCRRLIPHLQKRGEKKRRGAARVLTYGRGDGCDLRLLKARAHGGGYDCALVYDGARYAARLAFGGDYNLDNFMGAALAATHMGMTMADVCAAAEGLRLPPGRMQRVLVDEEDEDEESSPAVFVDYAHTADALAAVLPSAREVARGRGGRLWVVFGCGGERDKRKRAAMGAAAARWADCVVVTDDNPRGEEAAAIRREILHGAALIRREIGRGGASAAKDVMEVGERGDAIARAVSEADANDVVLILGKGHETYQERGGDKIYFSDAEVAREQLRARNQPRAAKREARN